MTFNAKAERRIVLAGIGIVCVVGLVSLWWLCARSPNINFLGEHGEAAWIIYPKPPYALSYNDLQTVAAFRRTFRLEQTPEKAMLRVRAFKHFDLKVNGVSAKIPVISSPNWKDATEFDIATLLHKGTNELLVTVSNHKSPPALWLSLDTGTELIHSDTNCEVSLLGAVWQPAWRASLPMEFQKGNPLYGGEYTMASLRQSLPALLLFALIALAMFYGVSKFLSRFKTGDNSANAVSKLAIRFVIALAVLWAALFTNNLRWLPHEVGYDEPEHAAYINYIRAKHALPLANDGWEMYQPPLYYLIGAGISSLSGADINTDRAATAVRLFGLLVGIAHIAVIFLCLRLLFPDRPGAQCFGTTLAACLPEHLYISQFVTNEFLAAALVTGALYFSLRLLKRENESLSLALAIGLCLGAALLTKFTAILAVPFIAGVLLWRIYRRAPSAKVAPFVGGFLAVFLTAFFICGWHYLRVWKHFGTPIVNNWDPRSGFIWWMDNGFQTAKTFTSFGQSLVQPRYSAFHGFWDGIYSTLWGDSLDGGVATMENRAPWDYQLMTAGYLLALLPTLIILVGFTVSLVRFFRRPEPAWFLLLGVALTTWAALLYLNLALPYYGNAKAFYALITLLPICAFGAVGWEVFSKYSGRLRPFLCVAVGIWALNSYASFWVRGGASTTHAVLGNYFSQRGLSQNAIAELKQALAINPHNVTARMLLAAELSQVGDLDGSRQETMRLLSEAPDHPAGLMQLALLQAAAGHLDQAIQTTRQVTEVDPDFALAYEKLSRGMLQLGKYPEAVQAAREALRITPFRAEIHFLLGFTLNANGQLLEASQHFQLASALKPSWAEAHDQLGLSLTELGRWTEAATQFEAASRLKPGNAKFSVHLAEAYAHAGQFDAAVACANALMKIAQEKHDAEALTLSRKMLESYQSHQPFHRQTPVTAPAAKPPN